MSQFTIFHFLCDPKKTETDNKKRGIKVGKTSHCSYLNYSETRYF